MNKNPLNPNPPDNDGGDVNIPISNINGKNKIPNIIIKIHFIIVNNKEVFVILACTLTSYNISLFSIF